MKKNRGEMTKDTAGNEIQGPILCNCCNINTAGEHEYNCPNKPRAQQDEDESCGFIRVMCDKCGCPHWEREGDVK